MTPSRQLVGQTQTPVLMVDDIGATPAEIASIAAALAPYPAAANNYPGVRRILTAQDQQAWDYVIDLLECVSPFLAGAFDLDRFDLVEASFSMVTVPPQALAPVQRIPHFDSVEPDFYAIVHYISDCAGTAFYRHVSTGTEAVSADNVDGLVARMRSDAAQTPAEYFGGSNSRFEKIGWVKGKAGRLAAYPGHLLHSGIIPSDLNFSIDPRVGRLTTNIFVRGWRSG